MTDEITDWITTGEGAKILKLHRERVRQLAEQGEIVARRTPRGYLLYEPDVRRLAVQREAERTAREAARAVSRDAEIIQKASRNLAPELGDVLRQHTEHIQQSLREDHAMAGYDAIDAHIQVVAAMQELLEPSRAETGTTPGSACEEIEAIAGPTREQIEKLTGPIRDMQRQAVTIRDAYATLQQVQVHPFESNVAQWEKRVDLLPSLNVREAVAEREATLRDLTGNVREPSDMHGSDTQANMRATDHEQILVAPSISSRPLIESRRPRYDKRLDELVAGQTKLREQVARLTVLIEKLLEERGIRDD
jgi:excisionase family DNA binding protein